MRQSFMMKLNKNEMQPMTESRDEIPDDTFNELLVADTLVPAIWLTFCLVRLRKLDVWTAAAMTVLKCCTDATCQFIPSYWNNYKSTLISRHLLNHAPKMFLLTQTIREIDLKIEKVYFSDTKCRLFYRLQRHLSVTFITNLRSLLPNLVINIITGIFCCFVA